MADLTAFDIIVLLLIAGTAIFGYFRGFVQEALSLGALIVAVLAVKFLQTPVAEWLAARMPTPGGAAIAAFFILFFGVLVLGKLAARQIGGVTRRSALGAFDRVLGFGFGMLKGLLVAAVGLLIVTFFHQLLNGKGSIPGWIGESRSYPLLHATGAEISDFVEHRRARPADSQARR